MPVDLSQLLHGACKMFLFPKRENVRQKDPVKSSHGLWVLNWMCAQLSLIPLELKGRNERLELLYLA